MSIRSQPLTGGEPYLRQSTPPSDTSVIWLDTSVEPTTPRVWTGTEWVAFGTAPIELPLGSASASSGSSVTLPFPRDVEVCRVRVVLDDVTTDTFELTLEGDSAGTYDYNNTAASTASGDSGFQVDGRDGAALFDAVVEHRAAESVAVLDAAEVYPVTRTHATRGHVDMSDAALSGVTVSSGTGTINDATVEAWEVVR